MTFAAIAFSFPVHIQCVIRSKLVVYSCFVHWMPVSKHKQLFYCSLLSFFRKCVSVSLASSSSKLLLILLHQTSGSIGEILAI